MHFNIALPQCIFLVLVHWLYLSILIFIVLFFQCLFFFFILHYFYYDSFSLCIEMLFFVLHYLLVLHWLYLSIHIFTVLLLQFFHSFFLSVCRKFLKVFAIFILHFMLHYFYYCSDVYFYFVFSACRWFIYFLFNYLIIFIWHVLNYCSFLVSATSCRCFGNTSFTT